jgi:hypothetical protein
MNNYQKIHGTTVDKFDIGTKNQRIVLTGQTNSAGTANLVDRDSASYTATSTVFFSAYIVGQGSNTAAYEIKGCYLSGTTTTTGYVVNTYVDTDNFTEPTVSFSSSGEMTVTCTGLADENINWTATFDFVLI